MLRGRVQIGAVEALGPLTYRLFSDELVLITAPQHRLARRGPLSMADLRTEAFVSFPRHSGLRRILEDVTDAAGFTPQVPFESTSLERIRGLVGAGLGIALLARSVAESSGPPVTVHAFDPTPIHRAIGLIHRADRTLTPAADACRELIARWPRSDTHR